MGKLDKLRQSGLGNAAESMGAGAPGRNAPGSPLHGATAVGPPAVPAQLQGVARNKDAALIPTDKIGPDPDQPLLPGGGRVGEPPSRRAQHGQRGGPSGRGHDAQA